jgi:glycosyltransferase involved in cell wall biosynthesis
LGAARNKAIQRSKGAFLAFLDADDIWAEDKLSLQVKAVTDNPSIDIVAGHVEHFFTPGLEEKVRRGIHCPKDPQPAPVVPAMLIRRSVFEHTGLFETTWKVGSDLDWFLRVKEQGIRVEVLPQVVLRRRIHSRNTGIVNKGYASQRLQILKAALERRRGGDGKITEPDATRNRSDDCD